MSDPIIRAVQTAVQLQGRELSADALEAFVLELIPYGEQRALIAIQRTRKEVPNRFTLADVLERMPGGHPGAEEAWATVAPGLNDERETVVMTTQMRNAFGAALSLQDDRIAARLAFKEVYQKEVAIARSRGAISPTWTVSLGWDTDRRKVVLRDAVSVGKLPPAIAAPLLCEPVEEVAKLAPPADGQFLLTQ